jgi:hypothetical protein
VIQELRSGRLLGQLPQDLRDQVQDILQRILKLAGCANSNTDSTTLRSRSVTPEDR